MILQEHVPLAPLTTLGLGGPARWLAACESLEDLREALRFAHSRRLRTTVIGGGSNIVAPDAGFDGVVIAVNLRGVVVKHDGDDVLVTAAAGEPWDDVVKHAVEYGWGGLECLSGIPGRVGATPIQNVGAYGQEVAETIAGVEVMDRTTLDRRHLPPAACAFGYRTSAFKVGGLNNVIVTGVTFRLHPNAAPALRYPELQRFLEPSRHGRALKGGPEGLREVRTAVLALRRRKSMVIDPADPNSRSVGSFFTNPVLSLDAFDAARVRWKKTGSLEPVPSFPAGGQSTGESPLVKVPAGWLVEHAGFAKGYREGNVGISTNHALALVNYGGSTSALLALAEKIQTGVRKTFGIRLEREPVVLQ